MTNPFRVLPEPLRVHILFEIAHHVDQDALLAMERMFPNFKAFLEANHWAMLELMDLLTVCYVNNGEKHWKFRGKLHRGHGLPAVELSNGTKVWWIDGKLYRAGGLPVVEYGNISEGWYRNHRVRANDDVPAIDYRNIQQ